MKTANLKSIVKIKNKNNKYKVNNRVPRYSILCKTANRVLNFNFNVYAVYSTSVLNPMYSTSSSTGQTVPTLGSSIASAFTTQEFINMQKDYMLFTINAIEINLVNNANMQNTNSTTFNSFPTLYFDVIPNYSNSALTTSAVALSDSALLYNPQNVNVVKRKYQLPPMMSNSISGIAVGGTSNWITTYNYAGSNVLYVVFGYLTGPSASTTSSCSIVEVSVKVHCVFAKPSLGSA